MEARTVRMILKWTAIVLAVVFVGLQFVRPARTNPRIDETRAIEARESITPQVSAILDRSCNDCHSNRTRWPWYSNVAPVSWFVIDHVNEGREVMNFSDWARYSPREREGLRQLMCREVRSGAMPLKSYLRLHRDATLSSEDIKALCDWANAEGQR